MAVPNHLGVVEQTALDYPEAFAAAHHGGTHTEDFVRLCAARIHALDPRFGLNGKRGDPNDISDDALNYAGEGADVDPTHGNKPCTVIDIIAGAGEPGAAPAWQIVTDPAKPVSAAWVKPADVADLPEPGPEPSPEPVYPSYEDLGGDEGAKQISRQLEKDFKTAGKAGLDGDCGAWLRRTDYDFLTGKIPTVDESIAVHCEEWRDVLNAERAAAGQPPITNWG